MYVKNCCFLSNKITFAKQNNQFILIILDHNHFAF